MKYFSCLAFVFAATFAGLFGSPAAHAQTYGHRYAPGKIIYAPQYYIHVYGHSSRPRGEPRTRRVYQGPVPANTYVAQRQSVPTDRTCRRIANPVSRRACSCSVANGGYARSLPNGQIGWTTPRSGAAYHAHQRCMGEV